MKWAFFVTLVKKLGVFCYNFKYLSYLYKLKPKINDRSNYGTDILCQ